MKHKKFYLIFTILIIIFSSIASVNGILSDDGSDKFNIQSVRGETVSIYGRGLYKHMSSEVAIQGIAQDFITVGIAIPLLIFSLIFFIKGSQRAGLLFAGVTFYFLITYLFYLAMGTYNEMYIAYVILLMCSFFVLIKFLISCNYRKINKLIKPETPVTSAGIFLIINSFMIAFLWLNIIIPPLLNATIYPIELEHYTTLIVQGFDLGLLLPMAFYCGYAMIKKQRFSYVWGTVYFVFLSILMTALFAKIIAMKIEGHNVIPVIFIIPAINLISIYFSLRLLNGINNIATQTSS